ncbi:MAG TPA: hypothetical protein VI318_03570 [Baekduia sp.]
MTVFPQRQTASATTGHRLGGPAGNTILTAATASVLTILLAAEGLTILNLNALRTPHMLIGLVLIPPLLVKLGSTGYRMVRYYTGARPYVEKGPPALPLRVLAPLLVAATISVFASGVAMLLLGHTSDTAMLIHKASFFVWGGLFVIHFVSYLPRVLRSLRADWHARRRREVPGAELRLMLITGSLGAGLALALLLLPLVTGFHGGGHHHDLR